MELHALEFLPTMTILRQLTHSMCSLSYWQDNCKLDWKIGSWDILLKKMKSQEIRASCSIIAFRLWQNFHSLCGRDSGTHALASKSFFLSLLSLTIFYITND